jgi:hypothetical protein
MQAGSKAHFRCLLVMQQLWTIIQSVCTHLSPATASFSGIVLSSHGFLSLLSLARPPALRLFCFLVFLTLQLECQYDRSHQKWCAKHLLSLVHSQIDGVLLPASRYLDGRLDWKTLGGWEGMGVIQAVV